MNASNIALKQYDFRVNVNLQPASTYISKFVTASIEQPTLVELASHSLSLSHSHSYNRLEIRKARFTCLTIYTVE